MPGSEETSQQDKDRCHGKVLSKIKLLLNLWRRRKHEKLKLQQTNKIHQRTQHNHRVAQTVQVPFNHPKTHEAAEQVQESSKAIQHKKEPTGPTDFLVKKGL